MPDKRRTRHLAGLLRSYLTEPEFASVETASTSEDGQVVLRVILPEEGGTFLVTVEEERR